MTLRERLDRYRARRGLSRPALAERWGVPIDTLRGWEGARGAAHAARIGRILNVLLDELDGADAG